MSGSLAWAASDPGATQRRLDALGLGPLPIDLRQASGSADRLVLGLSFGRSTPKPVAAVGWATVDLERAAAELGGAFEPVAADELLGATALSDGTLVLLEPSTEGRIAATLARHGEGPAAVYVRGPGDLDATILRARGLGAAVSRQADGPLGRAALLLGGPAWGPHVVLIGSATIGR